MDVLYFLPRVGKFGEVISKLWYIGGYIATPWTNQGGKVSFSHYFKLRSLDYFSYSKLRDLVILIYGICQ